MNSAQNLAAPGIPRDVRPILSVLLLKLLVCAGHTEADLPCSGESGSPPATVCLQFLPTGFLCRARPPTTLLPPVHATTGLERPPAACSPSSGMQAFVAHDGFDRTAADGGGAGGLRQPGVWGFSLRVLLSCREGSCLSFLCILGSAWV